MARAGRDDEVYLVYVDSERCCACGECVQMCPVDVFEMPRKATPVRAVSCMGCRSCVALCKSKAIIITEI